MAAPKPVREHTFLKGMRAGVQNVTLVFALMAGISLMPAAKTEAQGFTNLYNFTVTSIDGLGLSTNGDGSDPSAALTAAGNTLYGTAAVGGSTGNGTVFKVDTDGTGFAILHSFTALDTDTYTTNSDGAYPQASLILSGNTLYGTAANGGSSGVGTVFKVNTDGTGFTTVYNFEALDAYIGITNSEGAYPQAGLILSGNTLYGTATYGGSSGNGTVFKVNTDGTGFATLHNFTALDADTDTTNSDGAYPQAGLILSGNTLYGAAGFGGTSGNGTLFKVNVDGTGFATFYTFTAFDADAETTNSDGANPEAALILSGGALYGTAVDGGSWGSGTIFKISTNGTGFTTLHDFTGDDGAYPHGGLILSGDTLFGAAAYGNTGGNGALYSIATNGTGFTVLHSFAGTSTNSAGVYTNAEGAFPEGGLVFSGNTFYGTASQGGYFGSGTIFVLSTNVVAPSDEIFGFVTDWQSDPIAGLDVYADDGMGHVFTNVTDGSGYYSFTLSDGNWDISVDCGELSAQGDSCVSNQDVALCCGGSLECDFVVCTQPLQIATTNLPAGQVGLVYDTFLQAIGCGPSVWSQNGGSLPSGIQLNSNGRLLGMPTAGGTFNFSVSVTNGISSTSQSFLLNIIPQTTNLLISAPSFSGGKFSFSVNGAGGQIVTIQFSTNLVNWINVITTNFGGSPYTFTFPTTSQQVGFYRAVASGMNVGATNGSSVVAFTQPIYSVVLTNASNVTATVEITRAGALSSETCVGFATTDGTAHAGVNYLPVSDVICFGPNQTNASVSIPLLLGTNYPGTTEAFNFILLATNGSSVLTSQIVITNPPLVGIWTGVWGDTETATYYYGVVPGGGSGAWTLQISSVDWTNGRASGVLLWGQGVDEPGDADQLYSCNVAITNCECTSQSGLNDIHFAFAVPFSVTNIGYAGPGSPNVGFSVDLAPYSAALLSEGNALFQFDTLSGVVSGTEKMLSDKTCLYFSAVGIVSGRRLQ